MSTLGTLSATKNELGVIGIRREDSLIYERRNLSYSMIHNV